MELNSGDIIGRVLRERGVKFLFTLKNRWALQDIDQLSLVKSIVKMAVTIRRNCDIISVMENAFDVMDEKSMIVADGGDFVGTAAYILQPRGPLTWLDPGVFGTLGVGTRY